MLAYRKERIDNALLFFSREHYKKTRKYPSQTALYKYLAFFEFGYLKKNGDMPLELHYIAMPHGPVPKEIYDNRDNPSYFQLVIFEPKITADGKTGYIVKPNGKFNAGYFTSAELEEMKDLVEIFASQWIGTAVMSDASHREIKAWKKIFSESPNRNIDPIDEFDRDITNVPEENLSMEELRYLMRRNMERPA
jgi:hypothetical protein